MLMSLPSLIALRRLSLFNCDNLMNLPSEEVLKTLGVLHDISIARCRNLLSLGGLGAVGSLRVLTIMCCNKLEEVSNTPESLLMHDKSIKNMVDSSFELDMLKIDQQSLVLVEPLMNLKSTKELHICNDDGMTSLPKNWLIKNRASLRSMVIGVAESLLSLPSWMMELDRLRILHIERASLIKSIPDMPMSLRKDVGLDWLKDCQY